MLTTSWRAITSAAISRNTLTMRAGLTRQSTPRHLWMLYVAILTVDGIVLAYDGLMPTGAPRLQFGIINDRLWICALAWLKGEHGLGYVMNCDQAKPVPHA